jgi:hypothetical protein
MTQNRSANASMFIGLWLGLSLVAGISIFLLIFWAIGGFDAPGAAAQPTTPVAVVVPTQAGLPTAAAATGLPGPACDWQPYPASDFGYGIQAHVFVGDTAAAMQVIQDQLGLQWLKVQVRWNDIEGVQGDHYWDVLDGVMREACNRGIRVMLSVVAAPDWTHANPMPAPEGQSAPPDDPALYANFIGQLVDRYPGRVGAIEVWNEENLEREWNTAAGISPTEYVRLLATTYATIKSKDLDIIVISGALAPTGINCNVGPFPNCAPAGRPIVVDDVTYLKQFVAAGGLNYADCVGTHSNGTNLPPLSDGAHPPADSSGYTFKGPWDNPHYSWALKSQVETYAALLAGQKQQCVTEFGYPSPIEGKYPPIFGYAADVTEQEQGEYLVQAFNWMRDSGLVKMAFLFNLDYAPKGGDPATDDPVIYSIINKQGMPRPAFEAIRNMPKP